MVFFGKPWKNPRENFDNQKLMLRLVEVPESLSVLPHIYVFKYVFDDYLFRKHCMKTSMHIYNVYVYLDVQLPMTKIG